MKFLNVLNVEDSTADYELILRHLKRAGYEVYSERVETSDTMRAALTARSWDVVISDYSMPNFSGLEAFHTLKESGLDIPFLIISGTIGEETAVQAMLAGVNDYMMKNNLSRLVPAIEREIQETTNRRDKQKAEQSLKESEKRLKLALVGTRMGVWELNLRDDGVFWSPECYDILGIENFGGKLDDFLAYLPADHKERVKAASKKAVAENILFEIEFQFNRPDGETIWVANYGKVDYDDNDRPLRMVGTVTDITQRKLAERSLRESEENFRALVQATTQFAWTMSPAGESGDELAAWWADLTGQSPEESTNLGWLNTIHPGDHDHVAKAWGGAFESQTPFDSEYRVLTKANTYIYLAVRGLPVFNSDGTVRLWIGTFSDVSERKHAEQALRESEEQLRQAQKLESIGRLAGGVAHDFNNMLTAINGYSDLTLRSLRPDDPLRGNLEEIKKAGERSAQLTRQLLAFSRQQILQERVLEINQVIVETSTMLKRVIGEDFELNTVLDEEAGKIKADPGQLSQVLMNLVVNSSDAMPKGGKITIETQNVDLDEVYATQHISVMPGHYVMLAVSDTGIGIDDETMQHIFEPFFTTKGIGKGTGLGLSTVYGIIKQSGGNVWVYSELGKGTTFKIYFPRVKEELSAAEKTPSSMGLQRGTETILLVEDEELVRGLSRDTLESCGYTIIEAENGVDALTLCEKRTFHIDLLLTDVVMPHMGGRELAEKLSAKFPLMRVLFTSGYTDDAVVRHGIIAKGTNFLQKPFALEALARKVRETLDSE
jgi:PAS domain S-box-containing protein